MAQIKIKAQKYYFRGELMTRKLVIIWIVFLLSMAGGCVINPIKKREIAQKFYEKGWELEKEGKLNKAEESYRKALKKYPGFKKPVTAINRVEKKKKIQILLKKAQEFERKQELSEARRHYRKILNLNPKNIEAINGIKRLNRSSVTSDLPLEKKHIKRRIFGKGKNVILILASIHGDEPASTSLVNKFAQYIEDHKKKLFRKRQLVVLPVVNPDGVNNKTRYNANGVDINRNFPSENWSEKEEHSGPKPASEPETQAVIQVIKEYKPDRIISIQQFSECIDYDGPGKKLADHIKKESCGLSVKNLKYEPGSLGSFAGKDLKKPTITLGLAKKAHTFGSKGIWKRYGLCG